MYVFNHASLQMYKVTFALISKSNTSNIRTKRVFTEALGFWDARTGGCMKAHGAKSVFGDQVFLLMFLFGELTKQRKYCTKGARKLEGCKI